MSQRFSAEKRPIPTSKVALASSPSEQRTCSRSVAERSAGEKIPHFDPHADRLDVLDATIGQPLRELRVGANDGIEHPSKAAEMPPVPAEYAVDRRCRDEAAEPTVGVCRQGIGVHHQRAARPALPAADHRRARPRRRSLDMVWLPLVERGVDRSFVIEIAIAPVDGQ
jgi:hypothetical protein